MWVPYSGGIRAGDTDTGERRGRRFTIGQKGKLPVHYFLWEKKKKCCFADSMVEKLEVVNFEVRTKTSISYV